MQGVEGVRGERRRARSCRVSAAASRSSSCRAFRHCITRRRVTADEGAGGWGGGCEASERQHVFPLGDERRGAGRKKGNGGAVGVWGARRVILPSFLPLFFLSFFLSGVV